METPVNENTTIKSEIDKLKGDSDALVNKINISAYELETLSNRQKTRDICFRSITAILAVASPALVAYSSAETVESILRLLAIFLAGIAGAATTLQSIFGFKEGFLRNASAALSLEQVANNLSLASKKSENQKKGIDEYAELKSAIQTASDNYIEIQQKLKKSLIESYDQ